MSSAVEFRATAFDTVVQAPTIKSTSFTDAPDANAYIHVTLARMKEVFKMKSYDSTGEYVRYYIDKPKFLQYIDLSNAVMETDVESLYSAGTQDISLNSGSNQFAHDFLRYIAMKIFGSSNGVGLFTNNKEVIDDITNNFVLNYDTVLSAVDSSSANSLGQKTNRGLTVTVGSDSDGFYVDSSGGNQNALNIGWTLFQNLVSSQLSRASDFLATSTPNVIREFPFVVGDTISVYVTIHANPQQKSVTTLANSAIDSRTYRVRIKVVV